MRGSRDGQRGAGIALSVAGAASNQSGAALGALAFPVIGPTGVVAVRQLVTALVLVPTVRPRLRSLSAEQWRPILAMGLVFGIINLSLYTAVDRIGLGLAVTLEFLGPLAVAIAGSRRLIDYACAGLAAVGVVVLANPGPSTDLLGIGFALVAASAWAAYILLNRTLGRRLPGLQGTAAASAVATALWTPIAVVWFLTHAPTARAMGLAVACALLSSVVVYVVDLLALRRIPAALFGTLTSVNPVFAAFAGWIALGQWLAANEWLGVVLIVAANVVVSLRGRAG